MEHNFVCDFTRRLGVLNVDANVMETDTNTIAHKIFPQA